MNSQPLGQAKSVDIEGQIRRAKDARSAAVVSSIVVCVAAFLVGVITDNATIYFAVLAVATAGFLWAVSLDDDVKQWEKAAGKLDSRAAEASATPTSPQPPTAATDPTVVAAVITLIGGVVTALIALAG